MTGSHLIASEAILVTPDGPQPGAAVEPGDSVLIVDRSGAITSAEVTAAGEAEDDHPLRRLLTRAGEALVVADAELTDPRGVVRASDLADGEERRLEFIAPSDLPTAASKPCRPLQGITATTFLVPRENGVADAVSDDITGSIERLGLQPAFAETDRWLAVTLGGEPRTDRWTWADELALLRVLCAWDVNGGDVTHVRARMDQPALRRRLLSAYIANDLALEANWLPGYLPVECWLVATDKAPPAYDELRRVLDEAGAVRTIETDSDGALVIGPTIARYSSQGD